jgi:hypothetical protein
MVREVAHDAAAGVATSVQIRDDRRRALGVYVGGPALARR